MTYLIFTISMLWFPPQLPPDYCQLQVVSCGESPEQLIERYADDIPTAKRIADLIKCESSWKADAIGTNKNGTRDFGYFQWNNRYYQNVIDECFGKDNQFECELKHAIEVINKRGFKEWTCGRSLDK